MILIFEDTEEAAQALRIAASNILELYGPPPYTSTPLHIGVRLVTEEPFITYPGYAGLCCLDPETGGWHIIIRLQEDVGTMLFHLMHELAHYITGLKEHDAEFTLCLYKLLTRYERHYNDYSLRQYYNKPNTYNGEDYSYTHNFLKFLRQGPPKRNIFKR